LTNVTTATTEPGQVPGFSFLTAQAPPCDRFEVGGNDDHGLGGNDDHGLGGNDDHGLGGNDDHGLGVNEHAGRLARWASGALAAAGDEGHDALRSGCGLLPQCYPVSLVRLAKSALSHWCRRRDSNPHDVTIGGF
jgi:hypothetical protein